MAYTIKSAYEAGNTNFFLDFNTRPKPNNK